jgi:hypothetical protein
MSIGLSIDLRDQVSDLMIRARSNLQRPEALLLPVARYGATLLRRHYRKLEAGAPNKLGGERTHWWQQVHDSVHNPILLSPTLASIEITQPGVALRLKGGTVRPKNAGALAIPINRLSYGVWARDWVFRHPEMPLFKIKGPRGTYLAAKAGPGSKRMLILYKLMLQVEIPPDPRVLPPAQEFQASLATYAAQRLTTLFNRAP